MRRFKLGVVLLCLLLCGIAVPAHATVDWVEDFDVSDATFWARWSESCQSNPALSTDRAHSGTKSLKLVFTGRVGINPGAGGCYLDRNLNAVSDTAYFRVWTYQVNFQADSVGTKMFKFGQDASYPNFWWEMALSSEAMMMAVTTPDPPSFNIFASVTIPQNQWVCLEGRITMNTPGVADGIVQSWVNGVADLNRTNLLLRNAVLTQKNGPNSRIQFTQIYIQHGVGTLYYDDYAVSRDARIGCGGTLPVGDTTPPTAPSSLVAQ